MNKNDIEIFTDKEIGVYKIKINGKEIYGLQNMKIETSYNPYKETLILEFCEPCLFTNFTTDNIIPQNI